MFILIIIIFIISKGVGSDQVDPIPSILRSNNNENKRSPLPLPEALQEFTSSQGYFLKLSTEKPPSSTFRAKYGLKAPALLQGVFMERTPVAEQDQTTQSPFKSLIKVPPALNLFGDFSVNANNRRNPARVPFKESILSVEVPSIILDYQDKNTDNAFEITGIPQKSIHDELLNLHEENSILNTLIRRLLIEEVTPPLSNHTMVHGTENNAVEILVKAVKQDPSLLTRIQGLKNLNSGASSKDSF